ncbi:hypothetical protein BGW80DRAFT_1462138 [Lactifluus volemus]|nr:hypothetical protein BGW80DRAFT_1462138 [Lactifluus volemus]
MGRTARITVTLHDAMTYMRLRRSPPPPGTPGFDLLPVVSISDSAEVAVARKRSPSPTVIFSGSPRRTPIKSEKAKALEENQDRRTRARAVNVEDSDSEVEFPSVSSIIADSLQKKKASPPFASTSVVVEAIDKLGLLGSSVPSSPVSKEESPMSAVEKEQVTENAQSPTQVIVEDETKDAEHAQSPMRLDVDDVTKDDDPTHTRTDADSVMLVPCPDPALTDIYKGLVHLPRVCEIKSFSGSSESLRTPFSAKCEGIPIEDVKTIIKALRFVKCGSYVNTARVDPKILSVVNNRLRIADTKSMALCVMTGTVTESYLVGSAEAGPPHSPYAIHKVTIAPFEQDFRRDTALWGLLFDFHVIYGTTSQAGFGFTTRGEGRGDGWRPSSAPASPIKGKSSVLKTVSSSLVAASSDIISRAFDELIPVYDGRATNDRKGFGFREADFKNMSAWPLYRGGAAEIPLESVVSVIYTLGTYRGSAGPVLSSNLISVILLSLG